MEGLKLNSFRILCACILAATIFSPRVSAAERELHLLRESNDLLVRVKGEDDEDWLIDASGDLTNWAEVAGFGTILSNPTNAPVRSVGALTERPLFYRARRTLGLYDTNLLRTIHLTFTNANWEELLTIGRTNGVNTPALLTLDNGAIITNVGARYKGNTSFQIGGAKKSVNLEIDFGDPEARLMGYSTVNLNNAAGDETLMREVVYFNAMAQYVPCPQVAMAKLIINGANWGVYSLVEQANGDLIRKYFRNYDGDRWRTPNFDRSDFSYHGSTTNDYSRYYDLRSTTSSNAWDRLLNAITILNRSREPTNIFRDKIETVFAVDSWLWFLAIENVFGDEDSYVIKGSDFSFYYEIESGRIHPIQHDGNEAFTAGEVSLSPTLTMVRPLLSKLLALPELLNRYLAHMRTVLAEDFHPSILTPKIDYYDRLGIAEIAIDPKKNFTMSDYTNEVRTLKTWITNRYDFLSNYFALLPPAPTIVAVHAPTNRPGPAEAPIITAEVQAQGTNGIDSVWLYWRDKTYGVFSRAQMFDDGTHGDGAVDDGVYGGATTNFPAGHKIHYYVEARSAGTNKSAAFSPPRAEVETYSYRVGLVSAPSTPVVINELMASNASTIADPQGEFDDWIELRNVTDNEVDMSGRHLSDEPNNPTKWRFPDGTKIPAHGYLIIWADEDGRDTPGLHASFKLSAEGEAIFLTDTDENHNAVLDSVDYDVQATDQSFGRVKANPEEFVSMEPTPGGENE